ncbi:protein transport protein Sec31A isoform X3 [Erpetoichthys calabaricus]|uniref:protein transport protein Sec31A isoform X3 n=1 Tax=Erpetoichthys calabaricus TaxID=27687 RepID=UPI0022342C5D|nr:protein transport protein Sec31A isoform X3 [Erpetoichthys calabaricus]
MKLKEINRTAIQAWSPAQQYPVFLAAGTSAQQLDATFSTNASLEIFELDLADTTLDMKSSGAFTSEHRYHKLVWGPHGIDSEGLPSGILIAGGENGNLVLYDPAKIIGGDSDVTIAQNNKHTGPVRALDINPFQPNLVVSGANESEIYIWDLNNFGTPMTPGAKSQPFEDISSVAWNKQVQHILASASPSGRASVWDLRKNELIIKVSDHSNRMHCSGLAWNPEVATQLILASEDDRMPVIQMWDLRFATSPLKVLESHTRGILAIAWSLADPELLLSCGKDNRILCWNPNTGEVLYELPTSTQWCFDIQWCPRNPAVLSAAAFDGSISIYSIMGGTVDGQRQKHTDQLTSSFGNLDPFGTGQTLPPLQIPQHTVQQNPVLPLKKPPKWIRRPVGASFAFGGKLVTFENIKTPSQQPSAPRLVHVSQVVTETEFLDRSNQLQTTVQSGSFAEFCQFKIDASPTELEKNVWSFLKINFERDPRSRYLELLGYKKEKLAEKIATALQKNSISPGGREELICEPEQEVETAECEAVKEQILEEVDQPDDGIGEKTEKIKETFNISVSGDVDGLITQALLTGDFEGAVDLCLHDNRMADAIILAIAGGQELLLKTQKKYFAKTQSKITKLITAVVTKDWKEIAQSCDLNNWREALAAVLTYAHPDEFAGLCDLLGTRLETSGDPALQAQACLCYICAGNVEKLIACWTKTQDGSSPLCLQDLIEKVTVLRKAVEMTQGVNTNNVGVLLAEKMSQYANLLASQGSLNTAMAYLPCNTNQGNIMLLRDRLHRALGEQAIGQPTHAFPYEKQHSTRQPTSAKQICTPVPQNQPQAVPQQYYPQVRPAPTVTSWSNQTPTALPGFPPAASSSFSSSSDTQGEPPLPGFVRNHSSTPAYSYSSNIPHQSYPQPYFQAQQYPHGAGGPTVYQPQHTVPPPPSPSSTPYSTHYMHSVPSQTVSASSTNPSYPGQPPVSGTTVVSAASPFSSSLSLSGASFQHGGPGAPMSSCPPPPSGDLNIQDILFYLEGPQNGWNDPPSLSRGTKKKKIVKDYTPPAPITAPIMNPLVPDQSQQLAHPPVFQPQQSPAGPPLSQPAFQMMQQPLSQPSVVTPTRKLSTEGPPGAPIGDVIQPPQYMPAEKVAKNPIPEEHLILKITFEGLINRCLSAAVDPQTKRKLDDANKRLESLYDKLCEKNLSAAIITGLHSIARSIENRNYLEGLAIHTHIVSNSNFSETSAFMPVLKVVLTQANKLGV